MTHETADEMTCRELVELVTDYLENRLAARDRIRFEAHIDGCSSCRAYLEQMRRTVRALGQLPEESLSRDAQDALLAAFRDWSRG